MTCLKCAAKWSGNASFNGAGRFHGRMTSSLSLMPSAPEPASMGPAVSRPDDMCPPRWLAVAKIAASMGPAVSRPDDARDSARYRRSWTTCFNGAGRFTAG